MGVERVLCRRLRWIPGSVITLCGICLWVGLLLATFVRAIDYLNVASLSGLNGC